MLARNRATAVAFYKSRLTAPASFVQPGMMLFLTAFGVANHIGGPASIMEKLATATRTLWSVLLTFKLLKGARL